MKTTLHEFLKAAQEIHHSLPSLIALIRTFPKQLDSDLILVEMPELEFNSLENFPDPQHCDFFTNETINKYAKAKNKMNETVSSDKGPLIEEKTF